MAVLRRLTRVWRSLFQRDRLDRELDDELFGHLDELIERQVRSGVDPATARHAALAEMQGLESVRQEVRRHRLGHGIETTLADVRYALRGVRRAPGVSLVIIATLALGIGANTAIFSIVNAILIEPLPFRDPSRLVFVWSDLSASGYPRAPLSAPELQDLRERATLFTGFGAIWANTARLDGEPEPEQLRIGRVTSDFFTVLGAEPALGRVFAADDGFAKAPSTIVLSHAVWQRRYGGDRQIVGRQIRVNAQPTTIIGVMGPEFRLLMPADAAVPDDLQAWLPFGPLDNPRGQKFLRVVGRMLPAVTLQQASDQVTAIGAQISKDFTEYGSTGRQFTVVDLQADGVREMRGSLLALFGGVAILLLIACVNVASILVARAAARSSDTALRLALGAGIRRLARQYLVEGVVLAALGALAGLLVATVGLRAMLTLAPQSLARIATTRIDPTVLAFTSLVAIVWGVLFALAPLAEARRTTLTTPLQGQPVRVAGGAHQHTRAALVVAQLALGVVLLISACLMARTFMEVLRVDPGFESDGALTFRLTLPGRYQSDEAFNTFGRQLQSKLAALPGVTGAGAISHFPYDNIPNWGGPYHSESMPETAVAPFADYRSVTPGLMEALKITLVDGRFFTEADDHNSRLVVIVDEQLARRAWPGQSAIGQKVGVDPWSQGKAQESATVVGTVRHLRHRSLLADLGDQVYFPQRQVFRNPASYIVRTSGAPSALAGPIRQAVASIDPQLPIYDVRPLDEYATGARAAQRFTMILAATFAVVALALACVGVYGVIAYSVTHRRREFGVRLALGAEPRDVVRLAMSQGARASALGLGIGICAAGALAPLVQGQLFGVTPRDPLSYVAAALALGGAACLAAWLPARRAATVSPIDALRVE
jgi:putative ABC transport system permease protein